MALCATLCPSASGASCRRHKGELRPFSLAARSSAAVSLQGPPPQSLACFPFWLTAVSVPPVAGAAPPCTHAS